jgi:DNA-binding XRE family transcriptional regulator
MARTLDQGHDMAVVVEKLPTVRRRPRRAKKTSTALGQLKQAVTVDDIEEVTDVSELRAIRHLLGLTRDQLAKELGVSRQSLYAWEVGRTPIPRVVRLALRLLLIVEPL